MGNNVLCRKYYYKKSYKGTWIEAGFMGTLAVTVIFEVSLLTHNLSISNDFLKSLGGIVLAFLALFIQVRANTLAIDVGNGKREIVSYTSSKYLTIVKRFTMVSLLPLLITIFSKRDNEELLGILVSVMLILLFKNYLDFVVTFSVNGYSSGFDDIKLDSNMHVVKKFEKEHDVIGNVITFELYSGDTYKGYDKLTEEDYWVLKKSLEKN